MSSVLPKAGRLRKQPFYDAKLFPEQIKNCFVYHPMKLLILGLLAMVVLAAGSSRNCFWQWRTEARERAIEARQEARERAREFREAQREELRAHRDQLRAFRENMREESQRLRNEIRENMRDFQRDWGHTY
jgi:uncharacterized protein HemX